MVHHINYSRGVAQFGSALGLGPWGRGFESLHLAQITVGIAQLVRAPDCGSGGREFESHYPPQQTLLYNLSWFTLLNYTRLFFIGL